MFGIKSKRVKRLEAENYALESELRDLRDSYQRLCVSEAYHKRFEMKIVPMKCVALIDRNVPEEYAIDHAKRQITEELAKLVSDYATFKVVGDDMYRGAKRMEAYIRVIEGEKGIIEEN
jgi:hypothetical protein